MLDLIEDSSEKLPFWGLLNWIGLTLLQFLFDLFREYSGKARRLNGCLTTI